MWMMASNGHKIFSSLEKYLSFCCGWFPSWPCYFIANQNERKKTNMQAIEWKDGRESLCWPKWKKRKDCKSNHSKTIGRTNTMRKPTLPVIIAFSHSAYIYMRKKTRFSVVNRCRHFFAETLLIYLKSNTHTRIHQNKQFTWKYNNQKEIWCTSCFFSLFILTRSKSASDNHNGSNGSTAAEQSNGRKREREKATERNY